MSLFVIVFFFFMKCIQICNKIYLELKPSCSLSPSHAAFVWLIRLKMDIHKTRAVSFISQLHALLSFDVLEFSVSTA